MKNSFLIPVDPEKVKEIAEKHGLSDQMEEIEELVGQSIAEQIDIYNLVEIACESIIDSREDPRDLQDVDSDKLNDPEWVHNK
jgi:hypothetical protein